MATSITNTVSSLVIVYSTPDLTHLRYYIPLAKRIRQLLPKARHVFRPIYSNPKYNGLAVTDNAAKFHNIVRSNGFDSDPQIDTCDVFVFIEHDNTSGSVNARRRVCISHGFDLCGGITSDADVYLTPELVLPVARKRLPSHVHDVQPWPISLLDVGYQQVHALERFEQHVGDVKTVCMFYPDSGGRRFADNVVEQFNEQGYTVFIKQRSKWQAITTKLGVHVYDADWYPSESMCLPLICDYTVGFGSTAYIDLVQVGVSYCNIVLMPNSPPWSEFAHPDGVPNYRLVTGGEERDVLAACHEMGKTSVRSPSSVESNSIDDFIKRNFT